MKKLMLLTGILAVLLFSCGDGDPLGNGNGNGDGQTPQTKKFWAQNFLDEKFYQLDAELLVVGTYCNIWVEKGSGVSKDDAKKVADEYDKNIYPKMMTTFGVETDFIFNGETVANNTMEYADWLGDEDGKLTILLLDLKDGYNGTTNKAYTGGYFWSGNFVTKASLPTGYETNLCDMIYVDTNPGLKTDTRSTYATLAHEMQHLMSFATGNVRRDDNFDTWIDEGLSTAAEWVYDGDPNRRIAHYNADPSGLINKGNNFFVWDNHDNNGYANLDDYATVYLFFQWLGLHAGREIYQDIIFSEYYDYNAVTDAFSYFTEKDDYANWSKLLETWLAANRINTPNTSSHYGYKNTTGLKDIKAPDAPAGTTSFPLYPGEGIYSKIGDTAPSVTNATNIQYSYLTNTDIKSSYQTGTETLLTFNKNTADLNTVANGSTTGIAGASASVSTISDARSILSNAPILMDARAILKRNGNKLNSFDYPRLTLLNRMRTNDR